MKKRLPCFLGFFLVLESLLFSGFIDHSAYAQSNKLPHPAGKHRGAITSLLKDGQGRLLSAGEDGFLGIWDSEAAISRFQISTIGLGSMVLRPGKTQIAVVESDGLSAYRISAWDYVKKERLFTLRVFDAISFINYSAAGSFIIISINGQAGIRCIDSETGEMYETPVNFPNGISFAATSRSEKVMISYSSLGTLSYWDLETGIELRHFEAPPNISSPVLFGNNCYIGGFDSDGIIILDAVTGSVLARDSSIDGSIIVDNPGIFELYSTGANSIDPQGAVHFFCLTSASLLLKLQITPAGSFSTLNRIAIPSGITETRSAASLGEDTIILGNNDGNIWLWNENVVRLLYGSSPEFILDIAISSEAIGFISESGMLGYLPLDYSLLKNGDELKLEDLSTLANTGAYTHIIADPSTPPGPDGSAFLLWQDSRSTPIVRTLLGTPFEAGGSQLFLEKLPLRYPLRSAAIFGSSILFLNNQGTVSLLNRSTGNLSFSFTAAGSQDAAFIDPETIIIGRSAVTGNTPFLIVNTKTGETVPLPYPAMLGFKVYRGSSGTIYAAAINRNSEGIQTSLLQLKASTLSRQGSSLSLEKITEYEGEDVSFFITESSGSPVSNIGGGNAIMYKKTVPLERSSGLPRKAADGGKYLITLDGDGNICWHDSKSGKLLAVLALYLDHWALEINGNMVSGPAAPL